jgi:hypothetical protein
MMSNDVLPLIVAIVGVLGTLTAAVLTQVLTIRAQRNQRREEWWRTMFKDRRDTCVALSAEARRFEQALRSCLLENRDCRSAEFEQAWQTLTSRYSEAQIILPKAAVDAAGNAWGELRYAYDKIVEASPPTGSGPIEPATREKLQQRLDTKVIWAIRQMRKAMREALGSDLLLEPPKR